MAASLNKVCLIGNLGKDPEVRQSQAGNTIVSLSIATSESWRDKATGDRREKTEWHRVVIFNEQIAKTAATYLKKGSKVYLEGALQTRKWTDQQGIDRYTTEIVLPMFGAQLVMLSSAAQGGVVPAQDQHPNDERQAAAQAPAPAPAGGSSDIDDEIPF